MISPGLTYPPPPVPDIAVLGGDAREAALIRGLIAAGRAVVTCGRYLAPAERQLGAYAVEPAKALAAGVILAPLAGVAGDGRVFSRPPHDGVLLTEGLVARCRPGTIWLSGAVREPVMTWLKRRNVSYHNLAAMDELALLNSVPSAEGAVWLAIDKSPHCISGATSIVVGYGRTAGTLAAMLRGMGGAVTVVARSPVARARAVAVGHRAVPFDKLGVALAGARFCFNTVPAMVLDRPVLGQARPELTIIDLASAPGGTDFAAAEEIGITAVLAPGLPGLVAPETAGSYLAQAILDLLEERGK